MDSLSLRQRRTIGMGFIGLLLILIGLKFGLQLIPTKQKPLELNQQPAILLFNVNEGCECMMELAESADIQVNQWANMQPDPLPIHRIDIDTEKDLVEKYHVFRAPCMILVDGAGSIVWRQDYPLTEGGPFDLQEFEAAILSMQNSVAP